MWNRRVENGWCANLFQSLVVEKAGGILREIKLPFLNLFPELPVGVKITRILSEVPGRTGKRVKRGLEREGKEPGPRKSYQPHVLVSAAVRRAMTLG